MAEKKNILRLDSVAVEYSDKRWFTIGRNHSTRVVNHISLSLEEGEILGIVGESGGGKSTLLKAICKFVPIQSGRIFIDEQDVTNLSPREFFPFRKKIQMITQDFFSVFNPQMSVAKILAEPLDIHFPDLTSNEKATRIIELLEQVELNRSLLNRLPSELSGGQRQRLAIARGLAVQPELLICDEILSACDLQNQKRILLLLKRINREKGTAIMFVSHNIATVVHFCQNMIVMQNGTIAEYGSSSEICTNAQHPYTKLLIESVPHIRK